MKDLFPTPTDLPQGVFPTDGGGAEWRVWAPHTEALSIVLWREGREVVVPMDLADDGYFTHTQLDVSEGSRYAYRFPDGSTRPDPASRWQPNGVHQPSAVYFPRAAKTETDWHGIPLRELVIYELHVGTFTQEGTFDAIISRLEDLVELGITAIELLPIAEFPGQRNWGYDGVHPYAAQSSYGGPQGLQRLVEAAHAVGLGVILDVVYNHLGPEGNYIGEFGPYYSDQYHTPWGNALNYDGPDSGAVRRFVIDNAVSWVRDFGLDGLRLDAIQTIYDLSAKHLLAELQEEVQAVARAEQRHIHVIGETNQNDARLLHESKRGGFGLDGIWADDLHHSIHATFTGERDGYYVDFGRAEHVAKVFNDSLVYDGRYSQYRRARHGNRVNDIDREKFVVCIQNHDQVGNRPQGDRLSTLISDEQQRLAAALMLLSPFTPMLFMGEEYGETRPFPFFCSFLDESLNAAVRRGRREGIRASQFDINGNLPDPSRVKTFNGSRLTWNWCDDPAKANMRDLYRQLLKARRIWPAIRDHLPPTCEVISLSECGESEAAPLLQVRYDQQPDFTIIANLSASIRSAGEVAAGQEVLLSTVNHEPTSVRKGIEALAAYELVVLGPASLRLPHVE